MPLKKKSTKKPSAKRTSTPNAAPARRVKKDVEIDEPRQRAGDDRETAFKLQTSEGTDALAEELGEEFVENVTGANDAAAEHRERELLEEQGSFLVTTADTEFAYDIDGSNPIDAEPAPLPLA